MKQVALIFEALIQLKRAGKKILDYETLKLPSFNVFLKKVSEGKAVEYLEKAKLFINRVISNFESQYFQNAVNLLKEE